LDEPKEKKKAAHPSMLAPFDAAGMSDRSFVQRLENDLALVIPKNNMHKREHTSSCWKFAKRKKKDGNSKRACRFNFPRRLAPVESFLTDELQLVLRRTHQYVNAFNPMVSALCRCNTDIRFLPSGRDAKDAIWYVTDYITKKKLTTHNTYVYAFLALHKQELADASQTVPAAAERRSATMITRLLNQLVAAAERSAAEVALVMCGHNDYLCSDVFVPLFLPNYLRVVDGHFKSTTEEVDTVSASSDLSLVMCVFWHHNQCSHVPSLWTPGPK
jgi:hypothetical protein